MAWTTPASYSVSEVLAASKLNTHLRDNVAWLGTDKPSCRAERRTTQSISNNTFTAVALTAEDWDTGGMHSTVTNNSRLTVPSGGAGKYHVGMSGYWASNVTGRRVFRLQKNGATTVLEVELPVSGGLSSSAYSMIDTGNVGDYWEFYVFQTSGGALNLDGASVPAVLWAYWIST